ncbi:MAG: tetratricopeptide repeat protein, partial [Spirochaetia bacterium]|nr:tetratricopeptide repeat protein [Spirochaetia bacterium]
FVGSVFAQTAGADESLHAIGARAFNDRAYQFALSRFKKIIDEFPASGRRASAFYHAGLCQYYLGEGESASFFLNQLARDYPLDPFAAKSRYYLCKILLDRGQKSAALDEARTSLTKYKLGEEEGRLHVLIGKIYAESGQEELALREWKAVPGPEARFEMGLYFLSKGKNPEAEKIFTGLAESLPATTDPALLEKVSFQRLKSIFYSGKLDEAAGLLQSFLTRFPSGIYSEEARFLKAYLPYENKDFQTAASGLGELIASSNAPSFYPTALYYLARSLEECGQEILALEKYLEILRAKSAATENKFYIEAIRQSLRLYSRKGDEAHAREMLALLAAAGKGEGAESARRELAEFYLDKDPSKAAGYYRELLKSNKKSAYYRGLAYALIKTGRASDAETVLAEAVNQSVQTNEKVELLFVLAENFLEAGKWEQAEKSFQRIVDFGNQARRDEAREGLAYSFFQRRLFEKSRPIHAELRSSSDPKIRAASFYFMAEADRLAGRTVEATLEYRAFVENFPDDSRRSTAQLRLGRLYYDSKDYARAFAVFEKIAESE